MPVDVHDALNLEAAGLASEYLSLIPEVPQIVIRIVLAFPCGRRLVAIRAG